MSTSDEPAVTPTALYERITAGDPVRIIDIRNREEIDQWHITGEPVSFTAIPRAKLLQAKALGTLDEMEADIAGDGPITVVCAEGRGSKEIAAFFREAGFEAHNLTDGMEGWGDLYQSIELETTGSETVLQYHRPSSGCLSYLVVDGDQAAVIDPLAAFADRYAEDADTQGATLSVALDTHVHADHISGVEKVAAQTGATGVIPAGARERGSTVDTDTVADGDTLTVGSVTIEAVHAPGHTTDMMAYHAAGILFSGDSLFVESVARPDLESEADGVEEFARDLHETLHSRFERFDDDTRLAPGHYSESTERAADGSYTAPLGDVRARLALLDLDVSAFVERIVADMPPRPANFEEIIAINLGQEELQEETALELELGPNNCAATAD